MRTLNHLVAATAAATALSLPAHAAGVVEVNFLHPDKFTDIGRSSLDRQRTLDDLGGYLKSLGASLPDGQTLVIDIANIDLAGEIDFTRHGDLRVLRGRADWPRMDLSYTLRDPGRTLKSGEARLVDMDYLMGIPDTRERSLPHEKRMIRNWFAKAFKAG